MNSADHRGVAALNELETNEQSGHVNAPVGHGGFNVDPAASPKDTPADGRFFVLPDAPQPPQPAEADELPPLPTPTVFSEHADEYVHFTAEQMREYARAAHEAEKQAGTVAVQAPAPAHAADHGTCYARVRIDTTPRDGMAFVTPESADKPGEWNDGAQFFGVLASPAPAVAHDPAQPSPLSEQDKEDAELLRAAAQALACMRGLQQHLGSDVCSVEADSLDRAIRAARAKKEQP